MTPKEQHRFDDQYRRHLRALKLQGLSERTIDSYARAVRRLSTHFDACPDKISKDQLEQYFSDLVDSHSWSTVKVDRNGLQFFWKHILNQDWQWLDIVKAPKIQSLPDILTPQEVEQLIGAARNLRYRVFILATYSMGLRLSETLSLEVGDIDAGRKQVHIRRGKGHKDRRVPLPDLTYRALQALWRRHRHPRLLFPCPSGDMEQVRLARTSMGRGSAQIAMKAVLRECGIKKKLPCTPCATASLPICWSAASACARSRSC